MNKTENQEKQYLASMLHRLREVLKKIDDMVDSQARELHETKKYLYENKTGMDHMEKMSVRQSVTQGAILGDEAVEKRKRIHKLLDSPYFGRIDFTEREKKGSQPLYIGIHSFFDEETNSNLVHDWRAPVSSMFYDFEKGKAFYEAPSGRIDGHITLKRQYRIRRGNMEYMIDNMSNVVDEILQKELSRSANDKMKHIVATIQRDQNAIVRNETSHTLIIQGVAGSGKTSVALHRIAFLLYRFKETLNAENILIISPNKVFADYIANVLPELGEERVPEVGMVEVAQQALDNAYKFQTFHEQVTQLLEKPDQGYIDRMRFKASYDLITKLDQYLVVIENEYFEATDIWLGRSLVPSWFIEERFRAYHRLPIMERFSRIVTDMEVNIKKYYKKDLETADIHELKKAVTNMFRMTNLRELYKDFYNWLGQPDMFRLSSRSRFEYADVFPLIYMKLRFAGYKPLNHVKHLLVDEMQDYTPVEYAVLSRLFVCNKTILGDSNQQVNLYTATDVDDLMRVFPGADLVVLRRSYRSSLQITTFAQQILPNKELIAMEREGEAPEMIRPRDQTNEISHIIDLIQQFRNSDYQSLGMICKTQKQANDIYEKLGGFELGIHLLDEHSAGFSTGLTLTPVHLAKGLEFDEVIIPMATEKIYHTPADRSLLYIACTRAMHKLTIICNKKDKPSPFLPRI